MHFVYILKSIKYKRLYIGYTSNLQKRIKEHNSGLVAATKPYLPWKVIYCEMYFFETEARHREHNLKLRANAWNQLKRRIWKSLNAD